MIPASPFGPGRMSAAPGSVSPNSSKFHSGGLSMQGKRLFPGPSLVLMISAIAMLLTAPTTVAQTEKYLHSFDYNPPTLYDGKQPEASLVMDATGNLYGTTTTGGKQGWGTVFELSSRPTGGWSERILHNFNNNGFDGTTPFANVILEAAGGSQWG